MKTKEEKMKILERLVKEGHITLAEAFDLSEPEKEYITIPQTYPIQPCNPNPWVQPIYYKQYIGTTTDLITFPGSTNL